MDMLRTQHELRRRVSSKLNDAFNLHSFAKKYELSYSTLFRFVKEEKDISPMPVIEILKVLGLKATEINTSLAELFPHKYQNGKNQFYNEEEKFEFKSAEFEQYLADPGYFDIIQKAYLGEGINKEQYAIENGTNGLNRINTLIEKSIVIEKDGQIVGESEFFQPGIDSVLQEIVNSASYFDKNKMGTNSNQAYFSTGEVSKKNKEFIYQWHRLGRTVVRAKFENKLIDEVTKANISKLLNSDEVDSSESENLTKMFTSLIFDDFMLPESEERRLH